MSAYDAVVRTITREHHALSRVVAVLQELLKEIAAEYTEPDFTLLALALYYIDEFPEQMHHPKEDEHLFTALRAKASAFESVLDTLEREHARDAHMVSQMHRALVHYLAGAYGSLDAFKACVDTYAGFLQGHMSKEEGVLGQARDTLSEAEWQRIADAFADNEDPLFGQDIRKEFRKLDQRIRNLLPHKLRYPAPE